MRPLPEQNVRSESAPSLLWLVLLSRPKGTTSRSPHNCSAFVKSGSSASLTFVLSCNGRVDGYNKYACTPDPQKPSPIEEFMAADTLQMIARYWGI